MKKFSFLFISTIAFAMMITIFGCKKDEPVAFELLSLKAGEVDLNGATAATGVPANATIIATFSKDIDAASFALTLVQDYDDAVMEATATVSGATVTIVTSGQGTGTMYMLSFDAIKSTDGESIAAISRSFTTEGNFVPAGVFAYWPFDGDANDAIGDFDPTANGVVSITYGADRLGNEGSAAVFDGDQSIIEIPNGDQLMNTENFTISFWMKTNSEGHVNENGDPAGHFVMGLGAFYGMEFEVFGGYDGAKFAFQYALEDGTTAAEDMWMPSLATDNTNGGWQGWDYAKSLTTEDMQLLLKDAWTQVVYTYNAVDKKGTLYYNGVKMKSFDFNLWPDGDAKTTVTGLKYGGSEPDVVNELAFGFIQSRAGTMWDSEPWGGYDFPTANHFKGSLDEIRIFHKALSSQEVELMYNSESAK